MARIENFQNLKTFFLIYHADQYQARIAAETFDVDVVAALRRLADSSLAAERL